MLLALGHNEPTAEAKNEAKQYQASVLQTIQKSASDPKKDLTRKDPTSIVQCMIDAAQFRMKIDGRQHAHLVAYGNNVTLQIGYRGYIAKIKEHYPDAEFVVEPIYKGDVLDIEHNESGQNYTLTKDRSNVWRDGPDNLDGILVVIKYTESGRIVQKVQPVPKARIDRARKAAKQDYVWSSDYIEKAKAAAIKAACKHHFAALSGLQGVVNYDNEKNYNPNKRTDKTQSLLDNLNDGIDEAIPEKQSVEETTDDIDAAFEVVDEDPVIL
jgi:recombinational DNA repair protein RecT